MVLGFSLCGLRIAGCIQDADQPPDSAVSGEATPDCPNTRDMALSGVMSHHDRPVIR